MGNPRYNNRPDYVPDRYGRDRLGRPFLSITEDDYNDNSRYMPAPDKETGVAAFCPYGSCEGARLIYEVDKAGYQCYRCGREYPFPTVASEKLKAQAGSGSIRGISDSPQKTLDLFVYPVAREPRSLASTMEPEAAADMYRVELTEEERKREEAGIYNYKETEQVGTQGTYYAQDAADKIRKQKLEEMARRYSERTRGRRRGGRSGL